VIDSVRWHRQMLVAEIGAAGQARLAGASAQVEGNGLAHEIGAAYAARAGIGLIVPGAIDESRLAPAFLENAAARAMVAGSRAALAAIRAALGLAPGAKDGPAE
jgi:hypothetical protein